jgi:LacI family transcriptional regulator
MGMKQRRADQPPKLQDVAERAEVSLTTASMALSGKGRISEEVKQRVTEVAKELGYERKGSGKTRKVISYKRVGIIAFTDSSWSWTWHMLTQLITEMDDILQKQGYVTSIIPVVAGIEPDQVYRRIQQLDIDAVVSIYFGDRDLFSKLEAQGIPVVILFNNNYEDEFNCICVDDFQGSYEGTRHLIKLGHEQIAYIDYEIPLINSVVTDRFIGFQKAIDEYALSYPVSHRISCDFNNLKDIREKVLLLVSQEPKPTAIFAIDDYLGVKILTILQEQGIAVPKDISLLTPGDVLNYQEPYVPGITTMSIDFTLMGRLTAELIHNKMTTEIKSVSVLKVTQQLIQRMSCRAIDR